MIKKAAIYARIASPDEDFQPQISGLRQLALQRGCEVAEYKDIASGTRRLGVDALMADARRGCFSLVIVDAFDRLARNTKHFLQVMGELDKLGIQFISRKEKLDTGVLTGRLFLRHIGSIVELEATLNREKIRAGLRRRKLEGFALGRPPLDVDLNALVHDRLSGKKSLTQCSKDYRVSRASVVRLVKLAQRQHAGVGQLPPVVEPVAANCAV